MSARNLNGLDKLLPLELLVLKELYKTQDYIEIAKSLNISREMVDSNVRVIIKKLGFKAKSDFLRSSGIQPRPQEVRHYLLGMHEVEKIRREMDLPALKTGERSCLKCDRRFHSEDLKRVKTCSLCKTMNEKIKD